MKFKVVTLVFFSVTVALQIKAQSKNALVIAISKYQPGTGWQEIHSTNDTGILMPKLLELGFSSENIVVLTNEQATKKGIESGFKSMLQNAKNGDNDVIVFSCHGQQITDDNNDEADGFDEAMVPYDAAMDFSAKYNGENHLRDDEIGVFLDSLRKILGPSGNVLFLADACHSGYSTKGGGSFRGTDRPFLVDNKKVDKHGYDGDDFGVGAEHSGLKAALTCFYACSSDQLNQEYYNNEKGKTYGSLIFSFVKALNEDIKDASYRGLFDKIRVEMSNIAPNQVPVAEGALDRKILGGSYLSHPTYFVVTKQSDGVPEINGGTMHDINIGTRVGFYPIDTRDTAKTQPMATGVVVETDFLSEKVKVDLGGKTENIAKSWVFVTQKTLGTPKLNARIQISNKLLDGKVKALLQDMGYITIVDKSPDVIIEELKAGQEDSLVIRNYSNGLVCAGELVTEDLTALMDTLKTYLDYYSKSKYVRSLTSEIPELKLTMEMVVTPAQRDKDDSIILAKRDKMIAATTKIVYYGDSIFVQVKNPGQRRLFFNILDIQPNGKINLFLPSDDYPMGECFVEPGAIKSFYASNKIPASPPAGAEVFKIITALAPFDLSDAVQSPYNTAKDANVNPFVQLFRSNMQSKGNDDVPTTVPKSYTGIYNYDLVIKSNKPNPTQ